VLTILFGPILALLPKRWRDSLPASFVPEWRLATILSGLAESVLSLFLMLHWYSYSMATWVSRAMASATSGNLVHEANEQEIGFAAVTIFAMSPWTWAIGYCAIEGTVRILGAAFSGTPMGILPLYLVDRLMAKLTGSGRPASGVPMLGAHSNVSSFTASIRQKIQAATLPELPDEICTKLDGAEEILEIRATRSKADWAPPRVVRCGDVYYRLESTAAGSVSHPFAYVLRRLSVGVPGRTVLIYRPPSTPEEVKS
jgi:hypothetical protein